MAEQQKGSIEKAAEMLKAQAEQNPWLASLPYLIPGFNANYALRQIPSEKIPVIGGVVKGLQDFNKGAEATTVLSIPHRALNIAESIPGVSNLVSPEDRKYLESISQPPTTAMGKLGGVAGEAAEAYYIGRATAPLKATGSISKISKKIGPIASEGVEQASIAAAQEYSKTKDPFKAAIAGTIAGAMGMASSAVGKALIDRASKQDIMHPSDISGRFSRLLSPKWYMSEAIKAGDRFLPDRLKELTNTAIEIGEPLTVAGRDNLKKIYGTVNDRLDDAIEFTQKYAEKMKDSLKGSYKPEPGDPKDLAYPVQSGEYVKESLNRLINYNKESAEKIASLFDEFAFKHQDIKSPHLSLERAQELKRDFTKFLETRIGTKDVPKEDSIVKILGRDIEIALKKSIDEAFDRVRNISERYGYQAPADLPQSPWTVTAEEAGRKISGTFREVSKKAGDIADLAHVADIVNQATSVSPEAIGRRGLFSFLLDKVGLGPKGAVEKSKYALGQTPFSKLTQPIEGRIAQGMELAGTASKLSGRAAASMVKGSPVEKPKATQPPPAETSTVLKGIKPIPQASEGEINIERNNNPMAIDQSKGKPWNGELPDGENGRAKFETPTHGIRAGILNLQGPAYSKAKTLKELFEIYAPKRDARGANNPSRYAAFVASRLGISPDDEISGKLYDAEFMRGLAKAIIAQENSESEGRYDKEVDDAIDQIFQKTKEPPLGNKEPDFKFTISNIPQAER